MPTGKRKSATLSDRKAGSKDQRREERKMEKRQRQAEINVARMPQSGGTKSQSVPIEVHDLIGDTFQAEAMPSDDEFSLSSCDDCDDEDYVDYSVSEAPIDELEHNKIFCPKSEDAKRDCRLAVKFFYVHVYNAPPIDKWAEMKLVQRIARDVKTGRGGEKSVRNTMMDIVCHLAENKVYTGKLHRTVDQSKLMIPEDSDDWQFVADHIEQGPGIRYTTYLLNCIRVQEGRKPVGCTCVYDTMKRMEPVITSVKQVPQGSSDKDSGWAKARYNWVIQVLLRFGKLQESDLEHMKDSNGELPPYFQKKNLTTLDPRQVAFFDETHKKQVIGNLNKVDIRFPRDTNGKVDKANGTLREPRPRMKTKYTKQARKMMGVALDKNGNGCRLPIYDYTQKLVVNINQWDRKVNAEIKRVKALKGKVLPWYEKKRVAGVLYSGDPVSTLPRLMKDKDVDKVLRLKGINTIGELFLTGKPYQILTDAGMPHTFALKIKNLEDAIEEGPPLDIDHRKAVNPYESRFGENWEEEIAKSSNLARFVCITELIEHILDSCQTHFANSPFADNWFFYHDALKQMTESKCIEWMKEKGYYKHWVLPEEDLNAETPYEGRPVGNSPEMMPLDTTLIKDVTDAVRRHAAVTFNLPKTDKRKFDMSTPSKLYHCYERIWNCEPVSDSNGKIVNGGVPSAARIQHDINNIFKSMMEIYKAEGTVVTDCGTRSGKRAKLVPEEQKTKRGGWRIKKPFFHAYWTHPDAQDCLDSIMRLKKQDDDGRLADTVPDLEDGDVNDSDDEANL